MTKMPNLTLPLARLNMYCGHAFTLIRAECWTGMGSDADPNDALKRIQFAADTIHNTASLGWNVSEYIQGRASGRALLENCAHLISRLKDAEKRQGNENDEGAAFDWSHMRETIEEIAREIKIVEIDGPDIPTTSESIQNTFEALGIRNPKKTAQ
jgi:hypothetical protein